MRRKGYIVSSIVTGLLVEAALAAVVLWLLPLWRVNIPMWGLILLMVAFGVYEGATYRMGGRALDRKPVVSSETMVGSRGRATMPLAPDGYVRVEGELWRALSTGPNIDEGDEVVVVEVKRLTLFVAPLSNNIDIRERGAKE
jgi:membrane-bound ClpP family serine protease